MEAGALVVLWGLFGAGTSGGMSLLGFVVFVALFVWGWKKTS